ncbi:MAG: PEP-CTERM sorting domain-containing protein [Proteobacteria bacterium]|nr:PEP-CTERM sorting domain-containing protein [Pseudomonadota bacterium]
MKKPIQFLLVFLACSLPILVGASQITIFDNQKINSPNTWYNHSGEDQEVEPGAAYSQDWDLEGMFLDGKHLSIVGGWDFINKTDDIGSGDIFISTLGNVIYGESTQPNNFLNYYGYNFVFDVNWDDFNTSTNEGTYTLWKIDKDTKITLGTGLNTSNPVAYQANGNNGFLVETGTFRYESGLSDAATGFLGGTHYMISGFDLSNILGPDGSFTAHFTQECGNDSIMGQVPEPTTMVLLGMGLLGIGAIGRKLPL